jgi:hypothetical protein
MNTPRIIEIPLLIGSDIGFLNNQTNTEASPKWREAQAIGGNE